MPGMAVTRPSSLRMLPRVPIAFDGVDDGTVNLRQRYQLRRIQRARDAAAVFPDGFGIVPGTGACN